MAQKNALGRGLGALIEAENDQGGKYAQSRKLSGVAEIGMTEIDANPYQPRTIFDAESLEELADSIKEISLFPVNADSVLPELPDCQRFPLISVKPMTRIYLKWPWSKIFSARTSTLLK
jgi:hypothetical protein